MYLLARLLHDAVGGERTRQALVYSTLDIRPLVRSNASLTNTARRMMGLSLRVPDAVILQMCLPKIDKGIQDTDELGLQITKLQLVAKTWGGPSACVTASYLRRCYPQPKGRMIFAMRGDFEYGTQDAERAYESEPFRLRNYNPEMPGHVQMQFRYYDLASTSETLLALATDSPFNDVQIDKAFLDLFHRLYPQPVHFHTVGRLVGDASLAHRVGCYLTNRVIKRLKTLFPAVHRGAWGDRAWVCRECHVRH